MSRDSFEFSVFSAKISETMAEAAQKELTCANCEQLINNIETSRNCDRCGVVKLHGRCGNNVTEGVSCGSCLTENEIDNVRSYLWYFIYFFFVDRRIIVTCRNPQLLHIILNCLGTTWFVVK